MTTVDARSDLKELLAALDDDTLIWLLGEEIQRRGIGMVAFRPHDSDTIISTFAFPPEWQKKNMSLVERIKLFAAYAQISGGGEEHELAKVPMEMDA